MQFQFIDNAAIDLRTRKQIRSRVMVGKNAGKKRTRKLHSRTVPVMLTTKSDLSPNDVLEACDFPLSPHVGTEFSSCEYPYEVDAHMRFLINQFMNLAGDILYPKQLCLPAEHTHKMWFTWFQTDAAFFNCTLAMAEGQNGMLQGLPHVSSRTLRHLTNTYRCINNNLQGGKTPSDATVAAVMSIAMHNNLIGETGMTKLHLDALDRMVGLRGGIDKFSMHIVLLQKICRTDIEYALQKGTRPRFYRDEFPHSIMDPVRTLKSTANVHIDDISLRQVFDDLICASQLLNNGHNGKVEPFAFQEILISACYRLLHLNPLGGDSNLVDNTCYLALLAFITTMFIRTRSSQHSYDLLADRLRRVLISGNWQHSDSMLLWLLFVGGISVLKDSDTTWIFPHLRACLSRLRLDRWQDIRTSVTQFPWINYFHDEPGLKLWKRAVPG